MKIDLTIRIKNDAYDYATLLANKYNLSRSTIINVALASLSNSKYKERYIKQAIYKNATNGNRTRTVWSTTPNLNNLAKKLAIKNETTLTTIILACLLYIQQNAKKPKYLDLKFRKVIERNKNKWKRKTLI